MTNREEVRRMAAEWIASGDATGWFEELYRDARGAWDRIPWADSAATGSRSSPSSTPRIPPSAASARSTHARTDRRGYA